MGINNFLTNLTSGLAQSECTQVPEDTQEVPNWANYIVSSLIYKILSCTYILNKNYAFLNKLTHWACLVGAWACPVGTLACPGTEGCLGTYVG